MSKDKNKSQLHQLTLESLAKMDGGKVGAAFELALKRALSDCEDRPGVVKPRVITLQLGVIPSAAADDDICDTVRFQCIVSDTVPKRQTRPYSAQLRAGGMAAFNDESLDDVNQMSLGLEADE